MCLTAPVWWWPRQVARVVEDEVQNCSPHKLWPDGETLFPTVGTTHCCKEAWQGLILAIQGSSVGVVHGVCLFAFSSAMLLHVTLLQRGLCTNHLCSSCHYVIFCTHVQHSSQCINFLFRLNIFTCSESIVIDNLLQYWYLDKHVDLNFLTLCSNDGVSKLCIWCMWRNLANGVNTVVYVVPSVRSHRHNCNNYSCGLHSTTIYSLHSIL